jgi:hypothetical protein
MRLDVLFVTFLTAIVLSHDLDDRAAAPAVIVEVVVIEAKSSTTVSKTTSKTSSSSTKSTTTSVSSVAKIISTSTAAVKNMTTAVLAAKNTTALNTVCYPSIGQRRKPNVSFIGCKCRHKLDDTMAGNESYINFDISRLGDCDHFENLVNHHFSTQIHNGCCYPNHCSDDGVSYSGIWNDKGNVSYGNDAGITNCPGS